MTWATSLSSALISARARARARTLNPRGLRTDFDLALVSARSLRPRADTPQLAYLVLVEAALDRARDAASLGDRDAVYRLLDLVHNVPEMFFEGSRWSHSHFLDVFVDDFARENLRPALAPLIRLVS
jgi:hypothetical protein